MIVPMLRMATAAGVLAIATVAQAATPITLPLGDLGAQLTDELELPVPPPPPVARPDVSQFRLVLKRTPRGCDGEERRSPTTRRQAWEATPASSVTPIRTPAPSRWG